jgi:acyl-CoA synthetase (AMP-forming)/AMP-acid ligase II
LSSEILARFATLRRDAPSRPLLHLPVLDATWSAADVWHKHVELAEALTAGGVERDQLVVSALGNAPESVPLLVACRAIGAAVLPVDAGATRLEIENLAARFGAAAIASAAEGRVTVTTETDTRRLLERPRRYPGAAVLKLTSGSTGLPRAAVASEAHLIADAAHIIAAMGIRRDDTQIASIPVSHSYGLGNLMLPLLLQGTAFVLRDSFVPQLLPADARRFAARVFPGVPFMFDFFVANPPPDGWPPSLELLISAGAPLPEATARTFHDRYGVKIHCFYGASETGGIAYDDSDEPVVPGVVGRVMPGVAVTLRSDRIHVVSDAVVSGYSDQDCEAFVDGGFLTGDRGRFDAQRRLVLTGRVSSFVNVAGKKVQPEEVEQVLRAMPGVRDVRVVAAAEPRRGQQLVACIVAEAARPTAIAIRQFCASRLAPHKIPRSVVFLDAIPLTARGKTDRAALDDLVRERIAANPVINSRPQ